MLWVLWVLWGFVAVGAVVVVIFASDSHGSMWLSVIVVLAVVHSCHIVSTCWGPCIVSGCQIILFLCLVQEGSHADAITMTSSQQQEQFYNQQAINDDEESHHNKYSNNNTLAINQGQMTTMMPSQ